MDPRFADEKFQYTELFERLSLQLNTCLPGIITAFDAATQTATVQPALQMKTYIDENPGFVDLPEIINVPIIFPYSTIGGFAITVPVIAGDSCLLIFAQRAIDNWWQNAGVQRTEEGNAGRHHDMTDAFAILCAPPLPEVLSSYSTSAIEIRNRDATVKIKLTGTAIEFTGPVTFKNNVTFEGQINTSLGIDLTSHKHGGVTTGAGTSGVPKV